jgi:hypothetical protein
LQEPKLENVPEMKAVLDCFSSAEVVPLRVFEGQHGSVLRATGGASHRATSVVAHCRCRHMPSTCAIAFAGLFGEDEAGRKLWKALTTRVIEHVRGHTRGPAHFPGALGPLEVV